MTIHPAPHSLCMAFTEKKRHLAIFITLNCTSLITRREIINYTWWKDLQKLCTSGWALLQAQNDAPKGCSAFLCLSSSSFMPTVGCLSAPCLPNCCWPNWAQGAQGLLLNPAAKKPNWNTWSWRATGSLNGGSRSPAVTSGVGINTDLSQLHQTKHHNWQKRL